MVLVGRLGFRIGNRTIQRGSQVSFSVSIVESSNLCILGIIFIVLIWLLSMWVVGACCVLHDKPKFIENRFHMHLILHFRCWKYCWFVFEKGSTLLYVWYFLPYLFSIFPPLSNKIGFTSFGLHLQVCRLFFLESSDLSPFGSNLFCWTMMFLCIML